MSHKPCPYEDCGSTDAFSYNTESQSGRCHSCERKYPRVKDTLTDWANDEYPTEGDKKEWDMPLATIKPVPTEMLTIETDKKRGEPIAFGARVLLRTECDAVWCP